MSLRLSEWESHIIFPCYKFMATSLYRSREKATLDDVPKLPDEHLEKAKEIISRHRTRKNCKRCYDRGYQGITQLNMAVTCHKCVDEEKVTLEWQAYVRDTPALVEAYGDYFEADEEEDAAESGDQVTGGDEKPQSTKETARRISPEQRHNHGGSQPHRSVGR